MNAFKLISLTLISLFTLQIKAQDKLSTRVEAIQKYQEVLTYVDRLYVDTVDAQKLTEAAIVGLLEKLDPHSTYISKEDVDDANQQINGSFVGIGIRFQILKDTLMVVAPIAGGPSEKLGIRAGDRIVKVDGKSIAGIGLKNPQVREYLMGELGTKVKLEIHRRNSKKLIDFIITRDNIPVHSVDCAYMLNENTGYIKLNSFSRNTSDEMRTSLKKLKGEGMKNLILDLQNNGGGLLYAAKDVCDEFLSGNKLLVYSEGRAQPRSDLNAGLPGNWEKGRLAILTNENSASASEIVSGAIQDWDRGLIVGRRTFGKGLVQRPIELSDNSQIRLTIARYYTPSGRFIQKPYDDLEAYKNDYMDRYLHGELSNADSIQFPDSLKFSTRLKGRTVYGGGGIMPDVFVPLDTTEITDYFRAIARGGYPNSFSLTYAEKNREKILATYPDFKTYKANFNCDKKFMDDFFDYLKKENAELKFDEKEYKISKDLIQTQLKALLAQDLWGTTEFYQIYNEKNEILQAAIQAIEGNEYTKKGIDD